MNTEKDRAFLEAGIPELSDYLFSNELYWPITSRGFDLPRLTIGGLLLAQARLETVGENIHSNLARVDAVRSKWRSNWEAKAGREVQARLGLWQNYLADYRQNRYQHADAYPHEVRYRVMLHLLMAELPSAPVEAQALAQLDGVLRANLLPSDFIWDSELQPGFPQVEYWYLYGRLKS